MNNLPEDELVDRAMKGQKEAFGILVSKYQKRIYSLAYQMTLNHTEADDLSQEAFFKAYLALSQFKKKSSFYTWLYRITVNLVLNYLKRTKHTRKHSLEKIAVHHTPQRSIEENELNGKLKEVMNIIPSPQRIALNLAVNHGLSHKDIARIQGCSEGTVSWRVFQARKLLKEKLSPFIKGVTNEV